ncbi:MAG: hypothetical protein AB7Q04_13405 [Steroidobacteraceae bacterium]
MKLFDAVDFLNRPASPNFVAGKMAELRAVMARAAQSSDDVELTLGVYTAHISKYPPDVVSYVVSEVIETKKWFPLVSELIREMESIVAMRRGVMRSFEKCRQKTLANELGKYLSAG